MPTVPTSFVANSGTATPVLNTINIFGAAVAAGGVPVQTVASGNTVTVDVQRSSASVSSSATNAGLASFNSTQFTVDANGFVSSTGSVATETLTGNSGGAVGPTLNNIFTQGTGSITIVGNPGTSTLTTELTGLINHSVLVGAGTPSITSVAPSATSGIPLISQGAAVDPIFGTAVVAGGGTGDTSFTAYAVICGGTTSTAPLQSIASVGTSPQVLTSNGAGALPSFQSVSASGAIITITGNSGGVEVPTAGGNFNVVGTGSITVAGSANTETVQLTGLTNHNILLGAGTATVGLVAPTANTGAVLQNNASADPTYSTATYPSTTTVSQILYSSATNVVSGLATANRAVLTTGTTGIPVLTALATDGQLIIGSTAGAPAAATLTPGAGIAITNGSNSITIAATGAGFTWSDSSGALAAVKENGYFITGTSTATLPASPSEGDTIAFIVDTAQILTITGNTGQKIRIGAAISGAAGTAANNAQGDTVTLVYRATGTTWFADSVIGTWTVSP